MSNITTQVDPVDSIRQGETALHRKVSVVSAIVILMVLGAFTLATPASAAPLPVAHTVPADVAGGHVGAPAVIGGPLTGTAPAAQTDHLAMASSSSPNWAGYVASGAPGSFTSSQTTFVIPPLATCTASESSGAAFWDGLDGWGGTTVEQEGVDELCQQGQRYYIPWFEMFPDSSQAYSGAETNTGSTMQVNPGDTVTASTSYAQGVYTLEVADTTDHNTGIVFASIHPAGTAYSISYASPYATTAPAQAAVSVINWTAPAPAALPGNATAECIAEDPGMPTLPYANYGTVSFSSCSINGRPLSAYSPTAVNTSSTNGVDALTSPLSGNDGFTVTRAFPTPTPPYVSPLAAAAVGMAATPKGTGYWLVNARGAVSAHGAAQLYGSMATAKLNSPIDHIVATTDGAGYWLVAADGGIFSFGDAAFYGSMGGSHLNAAVVDIAPTPDDAGYWLVASDGGIFSFGDARFSGSMGGSHLNASVVGLAADAQTGGYWEVASDGGIFSFNAPFYGSTGGLVLNRPIVAMTTASAGGGYEFVASDGGIFSFGDAAFYGSMGSTKLRAPVVGMATDSATNGYWEVASDGGIFSFNAPFYGAN